MKITTSVRSTMAQALLASFNAGTANLPKIEVYDGAMPESIGGTITGVLLCSFELTATVGSESSGVITLGAIQPDMAPPASGIAAWSRLLDGNAAEAAYMTVSDGAGSDVTLSTTSITAGEPVSLTSGTITVGA